MLDRVRPRLTYAKVVATLALFIAIGGASAFAASQLGKNSVGSKQLKKNSVTTTKIKNGAVTGSKVNLGSLGEVPSASRADTATNALSLGGVSASEYQPTLRHAVIQVTGGSTDTVVSGNAIGAGRVGDGLFYVKFAPDVRSCTVLANMQSAPGFTTARPSGGSDPESVEVATYAYNSTGSHTDPPVGTAFDVAVIC